MLALYDPSVGRMMEVAFLDTHHYRKFCKTSYRQLFNIMKFHVIVYSLRLTNEPKTSGMQMAPRVQFLKIHVSKDCL